MRRLIVWLAVVGAVLIVGWIVLVPLFIPLCITHYLPRRAAAAGIGFSVRKVSVGAGSLHCGELRLDLGPRGKYTATGLEIRYSFAGLARRRLGALIVDGLQGVVDLDRPATPDRSATGQKETAAGGRWPVGLDTLILRHSRLQLHYQGRHYALPLEVEARAFQAAALPIDHYDVAILAAPAGQQLALHGRFQPASRLLDVTMTGNVDLAALAPELPAWLHPSGLLSLAGSGSLRIAPELAGDAAIHLQPVGLRLATGPCTITAADAALLSCQLALGPPVAMDCELGGLVVDGGLPLTLDRLRLAGHIDDRQQRADGEFALRLRAATGNDASPRLGAPFPVQGDFSLRRQHSGGWQVALHTVAADDGLRIMGAPAGGSITLRPQGFRLQAQGQGAAYTATAQLGVSSAVHWPDGNATGQDGRLVLEARQSTASSGLGPEGDFVFTQPKIRFSHKRLLHGNGDLKLMGSITPERRIVAELAVTGGNLELQQGALAVSEVELRLPVQWPPAEKGAPGELSLGKVVFEDSTVANGRFSLQQSGNSIDLDGQLQSPLWDHLTPSVTGELVYAPVPVVRGTVRAEHTFDGFQLPRWVTAETVVVGGQVSGRLNAVVRQGAASVQGGLEVAGGTVDLPQRRIRVDGLAGEVEFPDLMALRSAPGHFTFDGLTAGKQRLTAGEVVLQFESPSSLLLERARARWGGGLLQAMAVRWQRDVKRATLDLYCDRISLAKLLQQLGLPETRGDGTVNGHLPVRFAAGEVFIDQGYLYSTPGGEGRIRLQAAELLTAGIDPRSPQYAQLDFAAAALEDFHYRWVTLTFDHEDQDAVLRLSMNGRPGKPLPFQYDRQSGTFSRIEVQGKSGINQPIQLDVNFRIPFNDLLGYGKHVDNILEMAR